MATFSSAPVRSHLARVAPIREVLALMAVLDQDRATSLVEELRIQRHVPLCATRIYFDSVETELEG